MQAPERFGKLCKVTQLPKMPPPVLDSSMHVSCPCGVGKTARGILSGE